MSAESTLDRLQCSRCESAHDPGLIATVCPCGGPLFARYRLSQAARTLTRSSLKDRPPTQWRYRELLPGRGEPVSLGEGMTPLVHAPRAGGRLGIPALYVKDESVNPTGSFKARGLSAAVTVARDLGIRSAAIPTAGNAGGALAAYGARAGISVTAFLPSGTPAPFLEELRLHGAEIRVVDGDLSECAKALAAEREGSAWYDVSTLKEPYRIEGKKTMVFELFEQLEGRLPDVIIYPTGGGTGMIGMWKGFEEMEALGWIGAVRPRMFSVQAEGCAPIVRAYESGSETARPWQAPTTYACGLRVPASRGDFLILQAVRRSRGGALSVSDSAMREAASDLARLEGISACPEGGATLAALGRLVESGTVNGSETVVLFNTGTGLKYLERARESGA